MREPSQYAHGVKIAHAQVWNELAAKYRLPFYLHNVCEACCACSLSTPTMNLNYSAHRTSWNIIRRQMLSDFCCSTACPDHRAGCAHVSPVPAQRSQRSWPFANYSRRNPECVSLGLGAVQPAQMFRRMKPRDCAVSALWPMECAFKGGFPDCVNLSEDFSLVAPCWRLLTWVSPAIYSRLWRG